MKVAVSVQNNDGLESQIAGHFGKCPFFAFVEIAEKKIGRVEIVQNPFFAGHEVGQVPNYINESKADVMISGGMGGRAIQFFKEFNIGVYTGARGTLNETLQKYLEGALNEAAPCSESVDHGHGH